jgi:hypothetical protein
MDDSAPCELVSAVIEVIAERGPLLESTIRFGFGFGFGVGFGVGVGMSFKLSGTSFCLVCFIFSWGVSV